jgi:hypothetical protein
VVLVQKEALLMLGEAMVLAAKIDATHGDVVSIEVRVKSVIVQVRDLRGMTNLAGDLGLPKVFYDRRIAGLVDDDVRVVIWCRFGVRPS